MPRLNRYRRHSRLWPAQRIGDVLGDRLIAFPRARIAGLVDDRPGDRLVATEDHGDAHAIEQYRKLVGEEAGLPYFAAQVYFDALKELLADLKQP